MTWSERLSSLDAMFLHLEDRTAHMHVGAVCVYEGRAPGYAELVAMVASRLDRVPRYRQPLARFQTIGIALLSYCGAIHVGLLGDADRARDLPALARALHQAVDELSARAAAAAAPPPAAERS